MKKKGFTLIELLAVIVVLAVIALITVPLIINVVDKSKKNAFEDTAYGIIEAGKLYYMEHTLEKDALERYDFEIENKKFVLKEDQAEELKFTGTMPKTGMLQLHSNGAIAISICNSSYCACKSASELKVAIKDTNCKINSETGEVEDTESISEIKLKELEEKILALKKEKDTLEKNTNDKIEDLKGKLTSAETKQVKPGTIIPYMGTNVPDGYLVCNGNVYNISAYQTLANQIKANFGSYNYFGGNGTTTFAVPDLRGEFLRGTGTASRNTGTGSSVGTHQEATEHPRMGVYSTDGQTVNLEFFAERKVGPYRVQNRDTAKTAIAPNYFIPSIKDYNPNYTASVTYTSRPTNTAVLYCIKY